MRVPLGRIACVVVAAIGIAVLVSVVDADPRRSDHVAVALSWTVGVGEVALGLIAILAMIRHERRRS